MTTRSQYYVLSGRTVEELKNEMNGILSALADRIDRLEGVRGQATLDAVAELNVVDASGNQIGGFVRS